ncbi:MAG: YfhO family protein [Christensenellaceae bacterium]|nr:YfhO family protein [Christensenellaceae bacterium]
MAIRIHRWVKHAAAQYARLPAAGRCLAAIGFYALGFCCLSLLTRAIVLIGGRSILWQFDSSGEYYPATAYFVRAVRRFLSGLAAGRIDFDQFSFTIGLGGDVISTLNFYGFADPLLLPAALLPVDDMELLFTLCVYLRQFLSGLFLYMYLRHMGARRSHAVIAALSYAFCAFVNRNTLKHQNFLNAAMYLPLVLLGYERLTKRGKGALFVASVALLAMSSFYFLYMISLFLFGYALLRFFRTHARGERARALPRTVGRALLRYALGIAVAGAVLLPSIYGFLHSARVPGPLALNLWFYSPQEYASHLSCLAFPLNAYFETVAIWALWAAMALILDRQSCKRYGLRAIAVPVALYLLVPFPSYALNGFSYISPRSVFLLSFLFSCALAFGLDAPLKASARGKALLIGATALLFLGFVYTLVRSKDLTSKTAYYAYIAVVGLAFAALCFALLYFGAPKRRVYKWAPAAVALAAVVMNLALNETLYAYWRYQGGQLLPAGKADAVVASSPASSAPAPDGTHFFRTEVPGHELSVRNESIMLGFYPTACYLSVQNADNLEPLGELEDSGRVVLHYTTGFDGRAALLDVMGVKYFATDADSKQLPPYGFLKISEDERHAVYENAAAPGLSYSTPLYLSRAAYDKLDALGKQQALMSAAILESPPPFSLAQATPIDRRVRIPYSFACSDGISWRDGVLDVREAGAEMTLSFGSAPGCETYLRLKGLDISGAPYDIIAISVAGDGFEKEVHACSDSYQYHYGATNYMVNLGYREGVLDKATLRFPEKGTVRLDDIELYCLPMDGLNAQAAALKRESMTLVRVGNDRVEGDVNFSSGRVLALAIPWSDGWRATVDGQAAALDHSSGLTMALPLKAGAHHVVLTYENPWMKPGLALSALGLSCAVALGLIGRRRKGRAARLGS